MPGQTSPNSASWSASIPTQPFHFRPRNEPLDWRRMAALDVDRVEKETDINMLQDFISVVTFCAVERERCPQCRCAIDGTLLKVLRLSQFSTEYLLHCQDYLSSQVAALEGQMQGALSQTLHEKEERAQLEKVLQEVRLESRRRKKLIATQQLLLQSSANNYHKCQFCEKCFCNYSYLQSHVQRRHPEVTGAERQKKMQVEQIKDGLDELNEKLRLTHSRLEAEKEADAYRRQQELEEQCRRVASDREIIERYKEKETRTFQDEIGGLRQLFQQEFQEMKIKSLSIEAKLHELEIRERNVSNLKGQDELEKEQRMIRERELKEQMAEKMNKLKNKMQDLQNGHQQEKQKLESENNRLQKALSVEEGTSSSVYSLKQQVLSLSSQLREKETLIHSQKKKIKQLTSRLLSESLQKTAPEDYDDDDEKEEFLEEVVATRLEPAKKSPVQRKNFRSIVKKRLQKRLEIIGLRKGTKGISTQTLRSLIHERGQTFRGQSQLQILRHNLEDQLRQKVRERQRNQGKSTPSTQMLLRKKFRSTSTEQSPRLRQFSPKTSSKKLEIHQHPTQTPPPRPKPPIVTPIRPVQQKTSTPPFSSEEDDESGEDSAYITSSRDKQPPSARLTPTKKQQRVENVLDWSDSEDLDESDTQKPQRAFSAHGSVVQTLSRNLEKQMSSSSHTNPIGGIRVLPTASQPRPSIIKQQVSEEESDLDLSSIEELTAPSTVGNRSLDVGVTTGTSVWSSAASRAGAW